MDWKRDSQDKLKNRKWWKRKNVIKVNGGWL